MRRHVAGVSSTETTLVLLGLDARGTGSALLDGSHGVLEGTASSEMLSAANTTLDLLVLELVLNAALLGALLLFLLGVRLPVDGGTEHDVLTNGGGIEGRSRGVALLKAELLPFAAFGDLGVDVFADNGSLNSAGNLHFLVVIVETVGDDGLGAVLVRDHLLRGERGGVIEFFVVSPVGAAKENFWLGRGFLGGLNRVYSLPESRHVVRCGVIAAAAEFLDFFQRRIRCGFNNLLWRNCGWYQKSRVAVIAPIL